MKILNYLLILFKTNWQLWYNFELIKFENFLFLMISYIIILDQKLTNIWTMLTIFIQILKWNIFMKNYDLFFSFYKFSKILMSLFFCLIILLSFLNKHNIYNYKIWHEKIQLPSRSNVVKLGTCCSPSNNDWQPWSPILFPQKKKYKKI